MGKTCCCGCCSVRDGTRIIAILCIIGAAYTIGQEVHNLIIMSSDPDAIARSYPTTDPEMRKQIEEAVRDYQGAFIAYFAIALFFGVLDLILSGLLFHGAHTNQESRCRPWLYYNFFLFVVLVIFCGVAILVLMFAVNFLAGIICAVFFAIPICIQGYLINVVREYVLELRYGTGSAGQGGVVYAPAAHNML